MSGIVRTKIGTCIICDEELKVHTLGKYTGKCYACAKFWKGYGKDIDDIKWAARWSSDTVPQSELRLLVPSLQRRHGT